MVSNCKDLDVAQLIDLCPFDEKFSKTNPCCLDASVIEWPQKKTGLVTYINPDFNDPQLEKLLLHAID